MKSYRFFFEMEITNPLNMKLFLVFSICLVKFSAEDILPRTTIEPEHEIEIQENAEGLNEAFLSAVRNLEIEKASILIKEEALITYLGLDEGNLEAIRNKLQAASLLLKHGLVVKPSEEYTGNSGKVPETFNITLLPDTELVIPLMISSSLRDPQTGEMNRALPLFLICSIPGVSRDVVKIIIQSFSIDIEAKDKFNRTALIIAVNKRNLDVVKYLVENGANANVTVPVETEYLTHRTGLRRDLLRIFSKKNITIPDFVDVPVIVYSIILEYLEIVEYLLKNTNIKTGEHCWMALTYPAYQENMEVIKMLLENGFSVNCKDPFGYTALHAVAGKGHVEMAKLLLKYGADPNASDKFGWSPLHTAALFSRESGKGMMGLLLDSGSDINALTDGNFSPLNLAEAGEDYCFLDYLAEKYDELTFTDEHHGLEERDSVEEHAEYIQFLLGRGADVNNQDQILGWTTLHWAAATGDLRVTRILTEDYRASTKSSKMGMTPLGTARHFGRRRVVEYFNTFSAEERNAPENENLSEVSQRDSREARREELTTAFRNWNIEVLVKLLQDGALEDFYIGIYGPEESEALEKIENKISAIFAIVESGLTSVIRKVKSGGHNYDNRLFTVSLIPGTELVLTLFLNMNAVTNSTLLQEGRATPLQLICALPDVPVETVQLVLDHGKVDIDFQSKPEDLTALMIGALRGNLDVVRLLIERGAHIDKRSINPIDIGERYGSQYDYLSLFTRKNIAPYSKRFHFSALDAAVYGNHPDVLKYLLNSGANVKLSRNALLKPAYKGQTELMEVLLKNGVNINMKGDLGSTALHKAVDKGDLEMVNLLLTYGANVNATDDFGWIPLHIAALFSRNLTKDILVLLLDSGGDVNALTDSRFSPLNLAEAGSSSVFLKYLLKNPDVSTVNRNVLSRGEDSEDSQIEVLTLLLERGADVNHGDDIYGWTTLHWAAGIGDLKVARLLLERYDAVMIRKSKLGMTPFKAAQQFGRKRVSDYLTVDKNLVY